MSMLERSHSAAWSAWRAAISAMLLALTALLGAGSASAHEGHDHGPPASALPSTVKPRVAIETDLYQIVAIARASQLTIFLDRYATNEPITDAVIGILAGELSVNAHARADGSYVAQLPPIAVAGRHELIFNVAHKNGDDLLAGTLEISAPPAAPERAAISRRFSLFHLLATALALFVGIAIGLSVRAPRTAVVVTAMALCAALLTTAAQAHEGHEASPVPQGESLSGDTPRRLADGSVFLPKPSQRLLTIRSQVAVEGQGHRAVSLVGRIISDPNRSGIVQSITGGRVQPPAGGLPRLGQTVKQGDILAAVVPALPLADQSTLAEKQRELEGAVLLARQRLARLNRLGGNVTPRSNIEDTELEIANLEHRLTSLRQVKLQPETLTSPIDGVISVSRILAGQVVASQDILFQIVDPASLWVEALVFDQLDPGAIVEATAIAQDATSMRLSYRGRGRALQAQAVQIQFAIDAPPANAVIGQPVTVIARQAQSVKGMLLPRDAIVRGSAGETMLWHHIDPERFVARQVRVEPFDGDRILVTGGISPKDRIVVHGAELLGQVR